MMGMWLFYVQDADYLLGICWPYACTHEAALLSDAVVERIWYCPMILGCHEAILGLWSCWSERE